MNIDLVYYFREVNHNYFLNGPEKVNGNIVNNSPAYQFSSANDVVTKINQMIASLAPEITNVGLVTSELYTGDIQVNTYRGELNVSSAPDYTNILTNINTNLTNLNSKFVNNSNINIARILESLYNCFNGVGVNENADIKRNNSLIKSLDNKFMYSVNSTNVATTLLKILSCFSSSFANNETVSQSNSGSYLKAAQDCLKQSVSPNANITDVISSLNTNIHNDLTELNTTTNNKDTVLIVDGQQDFVLRKQNNDDYDS